jgi:hypothetical protein
VRSDYWNVTDEQVVEKTGKHLAEWKKILTALHAKSTKSNEIVAALQKEHDVPRYWARTLTTWFAKQAT